MKRLRKRYGADIRFFHCGEYGEMHGRPHYHACIFNFDFADKTVWKIQNDNPLYVSVSLSELWPMGFSSIGEVTFQSAAYVARYIMKKITGPAAAGHYEHIDQLTGEVFERKPEYTTMSRRPGIGHGWLERFRGDIYPSDFVVMNGKKMRPPRYYDEQMEHCYPSDYRRIKNARVVNAKKHKENNTPARLKVREAVQEARLQRLPRPVE